MNLLASILVFIVLFLLYLNISAEFDKGKNYEIYEVDYISRNKLQDAMKPKQPLVFPCVLPECHYLNTLRLDDLVEKYGEEEVQMCDGGFAAESVPLSLEKAAALIETKAYFSRDNNDFVQEFSALRDAFHGLDLLLRPFNTILTTYDFCFASPEVATPLEYHTYSASFVFVSQGIIRVKLAPYRVGIAERRRCKDRIGVAEGADLDKIRFLKAEIQAGSILYIPPYWWYSIDVHNTSTWYARFNYSTWMNRLARLPDLFWQSKKID